MRIGILGTGVFGLAIASILYKNEHQIEMWTTFEEEAKELNNNRIRKNLDNYEIPKDIIISTDLEKTCRDKDLIVIAVPAEFVDSTCNKITDYIDNQHFCIASKGIEENSKLFLYDIVKNIIGNDRISVISGPSFAIDIINEAPIGLSLASHNRDTIELVYNALSNDKVKIFRTHDVTGTCLCGAIKNVIAIASGIIDGMGYPISTQAMLITESLHDIEELIHNLGGNQRSILSFAGFGDIILTCTSPKSRNYSFGKMLASKNKEEIDDYMKKNTIEGLVALRSIHNIINSYNIDIPIINLIYDIVYNNKPVESIVEFLTK